MIVLDTSGLFAALTRNQRLHGEAKAAVDSEPHPLVLSPFVLAELDYFLLREGGATAEAALLGAVASGAYELASFTVEDVATAQTVVEKYADLGIGLTDASIVVLAERYETDGVLTLDERHFRAMTTLRGAPFRVLPADA